MHTTRLGSLILALASVLCGSMFAAEPMTEPLQILDTVQRLAFPIDAAALAARTGWKPLDEDDTTHEFRGDAVLANERIMLVFRQGAPGVEVYGSGSPPALRAILAPAGDSGTVGKITVVENTASEIAVKTAFGLSNGRQAELRFELQPGQAFVKTDRERNAERLRIDAPCRYGLLPDFFASDIVLDATEIRADRAELPSENFFLHLAGRGDSLVVAIWNQRDKEIEINLAGSGDSRSIKSSEIPYGEKGSVFVGVMQAPGIWHEYPVSLKDTDKIVPLSWHAPYPAHWRMDWRQASGLNDSWEMLIERNKGEFEKPDWFGQADSYGNLDWMQGGRKRWTTVLGFFQYPCWIDIEGAGFIQPLKRPGNFQGKVLVYPVNRIAATPLDTFTFVDLVRATLGVGPCQYVLDVEGQTKKSAGKPTCDTRTRLNAIYSSGKQIEKKADVEKALDDVLAFMQHIRGRIEDYAAFSREMQQYLQQQKASRPELASFVSSMEAILKRIDESVAERVKAMHAREYAKQLVDEFRGNLVGYNGPDALDRCKKLTAGFVEIGGNQDELVGECRLAVRILRQQAAMAMANDPQVTDVAQEIRRRTHSMLRNPTSYEAPRH
jgi:hypothetical protein